MKIQVERIIAGVPNRVMTALVAPAELSRWACEMAEVTGESYRLTGRHVALGGLGGRLLERTERSLRFEWTLGEQVSTVTVELEAVPQQGMPPADFTRVRVLHSSVPENVLPAKSQQESYECVWLLWLRQLEGWVERAEAPGPFDYARAFGRTVEQSVVMDAPAARIWQALTEPALRKRWLTVPLGRELQREEGRLLVCEFEVNEPPTTVTWLLEELSGGRTRVTVREEGLTWEGMDDHIGWHEYLVALYQESQPPLIRQTIHIQAAPAKVWPYVSTEVGLRRWFAGNIRFEAKVGAPVAFEEHGGALRGKVAVVEPERKLAFTWTELDAPGWPQDPAPTMLTVELVPEDGGTRVTITHAGFENLPEAIRPGQFASYQRGWAYGTTLPKLKWALEREIRFETYIAAPPARVWRAVESQEMVRRWLGQRVEFEPGLGGRVRVYDTTGTWEMGGPIIEWEVGRRMTFLWECFAPETHAPTHFTLELVPEGAGTRVVLLHHRFELVTEEDFHGYQHGWGDGQRQVTGLTEIALEAA